MDSRGYTMWYIDARRVAIAAPFITGKSTLTRDPVKKQW